MENKLFFVLVTVCIFTHIIRSGYEILKHKQGVKADKITFIIIFTNMMLLWMSWFMLCSLDPYDLHLPLIIRIAGILLAGTGLYCFLTGLFTIKTLESYDGDLITKGIYSKIRHPMYLGFICWLVGFPLYNSGMFSMILAIPLIINVLYWRYLEEMELVKRFPGYPEYKKSTFF